MKGYRLVTSTELAMYCRMLNSVTPRLAARVLSRLRRALPSPVRSAYKQKVDREQPERPFPTHHDEDQPPSSAAAATARVGASSAAPARGFRGLPQGLEHPLGDARTHPHGASFRLLCPGRLGGRASSAK